MIISAPPLRLVHVGLDSVLRLLTDFLVVLLRLIALRGDLRIQGSQQLTQALVEDSLKRRMRTSRSILALILGSLLGP
jgi:hypothetical protein